ncbi:TadE/TadG family type IV pilus assembly protein [Sphingobium sp. CAP-1]|uniref:TadE/TadG family type IV pilus assembly protein n=1 Tax=Sphingobium sp. CAP-1 TaxID=2676077 RepID=UPI0012BB3BCD|nr:pilus assembly protein [Sphingobium sp. CAP-1]QGP80876.1 pilus assembly protein [Sphingobium sp. CAP-1]
MKTARHLPAFLQGLRRDESGLALIEFAFSLPVLVVLGMTGLECANLSLAHLRVSQVAMLVADNAARVRTSIDEADVNEIMTGADLSTEALKLKANGRIFLSDLEPNGKASPNTGQYIRWQRCWGSGSFTSSYGVAGDGTNDATMVNGMGPGTTAATKVSAASGTAVMFVEVAYNYQPLVSSAIFGSRVIRYSSAFNVRERTDQAIKNAGGLATSATAACT